MVLNVLTCSNCWLYAVLFNEWWSHPNVKCKREMISGNVMSRGFTVCIPLGTISNKSLYRCLLLIVLSCRSLLTVLPEPPTHHSYCSFARRTDPLCPNMLKCVCFIIGLSVSNAASTASIFHKGHSIWSNIIRNTGLNLWLPILVIILHRCIYRQMPSSSSVTDMLLFQAHSGDLNLKYLSQ